MSKRAKRVIKAALEWERARRRHEAKPSSGRMVEVTYAIFDLLDAVRAFRRR